MRPTALTIVQTSRFQRGGKPPGAGAGGEDRQENVGGEQRHQRRPADLFERHGRTRRA